MVRETPRNFGVKIEFRTLGHAESEVLQTSRSACAGEVSANQALYRGVKEVGQIEIHVEA